MGVEGAELILLVDDETIILDVAKSMLQRIGYKVIPAKGGRQALNIFSKTAKNIDLVILDLIMPGLDGAATFSHIRKIDPKVPVLLSSGYAINGQAETLMRQGCNGFIQKPYNLEGLSEKVHGIIDKAKLQRHGPGQKDEPLNRCTWMGRQKVTL